VTAATGIDLLTPALAAGRGLASRQLSDLGAAVEGYVAEVGVDALLAMIPPGVERAYLAQLDGGPLLALRRYAAGERSTIHSHAWTVLVQLQGEAVFDRWRVVEDGTADLVERRSLGVGALTLIGDGEPHRQWARTDVVEAVLIARYDDEAPKVDHPPSASGEEVATLIDGYVDAFAATDADAIASHYAAEMLVDVNVPTWRFQVSDPQELRALLQVEEFQAGYRLARWRANPTADGVLVELEARYGENPDQRMAREMHHLVRGPEGITEHVLFCTGVWSPATVAAQAAEAPMVRW
jgi:hypothetical protein